MRTVHGNERMEEEARIFVDALEPVSGAARVITLSGDLGAGKTTFVKGMARALGIEEHVTSPTFVIMKIYQLSGQKFQRLVHIDAYRLKGMHHLKVLGWEKLIEDPRNLICIEWPEKIEGAIPGDAIRISLSYSDEHTREILYGNKKDN